MTAPAVSPDWTASSPAASPPLFSASYKRLVLATLTLGLCMTAAFAALAPRNSRRLIGGSWGMSDNGAMSRQGRVDFHSL